MKRAATEQAEDSPPAKRIRRDVETLNRMQYFMMDLSAGYLSLLHAFQYLKVHELLRASRVCHMWRDIAMHKTLVSICILFLMCVTNSKLLVTKEIICA